MKKLLFILPILSVFSIASINESRAETIGEWFENLLSDEQDAVTDSEKSAETDAEKQKESEKEDAEANEKNKPVPLNEYPIRL